MTYENSTTPSTPDADAPAPPPWLQFAPPPADPATEPNTRPPSAPRTDGSGRPPFPEASPQGPQGPQGPPPSVDGPWRQPGPPFPGSPPFPGGAHAPGEPASHDGPLFPDGPAFPGGPAFDDGPQAPHDTGIPVPGPPPGQFPGRPGPSGPPPVPPNAHPSPHFPHPGAPGAMGPAGPGPAPVYPGQPMPPGYGPPHGGPSLDEVALIRKARRAPSRGWRRAVHTLSAGAINPGESQGDIEFQQLLERVNRPVRGDYRIAVLSLKGGVGKTTTTVGLGSTFASLRGDRVIAVDANPDLGTLAQRVPQQTRSTVRDLLADENVYRYSDVRAHTSQAPSRLEVLASERDPAMAEAFNEEEYRGVITILQRFYNIIITDCGTGLSHSAMNGVLDLANMIILVSSPALDGARSAGATLDWLEAHGFGHLVSRAVVVLSSSRPGSSTIDTDQLGQHFLTRCRAVHKIPFDDHLAEGADVDLELMSKATKYSFVQLAATIADDFSGTTLHREEPFQG
ncbi:AAA family ATPase [Gordonia jinghuaiqii]|uniref:MinD/ParA family protein n=1 Tax=Gordonia jinghuaiqii TaxID=2758710 RepID=A0A7D7LV47_9ACTN|nr:MinD/ParA family protein [Gordonia jinghuaiqii]MCR5979569.1 AAA family ATPase [Gordonia jinghuaiqii]QMT00639.1 MinD/ParA family protein [Gordonia jinghuaiqii]